MPEEMNVVTTLVVCSDCVYASQYGVREMDLPEEVEQRVIHGLSHWPYTSFHFDEDEGVHFSFSPCYLCGDRLGGDRYTLEALRWKE